MKILFLTSRLPYPLDKGDKLRAFHQIKALSVHADIYLISITEDDTPKEHIVALQPFLAQCHLLRITYFERIVSLIKAIWSKLPFQAAWFYSPAIHKHISVIVNDIQPDVIFVQLARMAPYRIEFSRMQVIDFMDAFGVGMERRAGISQGITQWLYRLEGRRMIAYEQKIAEQFDLRIIISKQDGDQIFSDQNNEIHIIPNGIDSSFLEYNKTIAKTADISFIGNMSYLPNIEAAIYLCDHILPLLPSHTTIEIAGTSPDRRVKSLANDRVTVTGYVDDIRDAYARGKVFCAPLWSGTGQQNKILEAMAMGIPCITTSSVNQAIGGMHMKEILIADDAKQFAAAIEMILGDEKMYTEIASNANKYVEKNFRWEQQAKALMEMLALSKSMNHKGKKES